MDSSAVFTCVHCGHLSKSASHHERHYLSHRHLSLKIVCGFIKCSSVLPNGPAFRSHVTRAHRKFSSVGHHPTLSQLPMTENQFKCPVDFCGERFFYVRLLNSHLKKHFQQGISCPCPVVDCKRVFSSLHSLTGHLSKCHRNSSSSFQVDNGGHISTVRDVPELVEDIDVISSDCQNIVAIQSQPDELLRTLAQFFQKLSYKYLVPESTVQVISDELKILMSNSQQILLDSVNASLSNFKVEPNVINEALDSARNINNLPVVFHELRTNHIRKKTFKSLFAFVEPQRIDLGNGKFFFYIPIGETLQACFSNRSWVKFLRLRPENVNNGVLLDFTDGSAFKNNNFFSSNPYCIRIILYQDGVELVNPLGPAKNLNHNVIAVYMALGNLPSYMRYSKENIQLVALCQKQDFDHSLVYGKIVSDLLILQNSGCDIQGIGNVKVGLVCISGDNLGSHSLGGFLENFSKALYFCRYCLLTRPSFFANGGEVLHFPPRTVDSYNNAVKKVSLSKKAKASSMGVKFDSEFNKVEGFHVCDNGLPPCIGHEICEGVIAYDLKLFIQYFHRKGAFSLEALNQAIDEFPYSIEDRKDKPVKIKKIEKARLAGNAWQLRTFMRLFPLMVASYIDLKDEVWQCVLLLAQITDIVVAPEIHVSQLPALQALIDEYLVKRRELFPNIPLRPKHHFMFHYPYLISVFGPLMKVWTMRFESKHCFFKSAWKCSRNSINILKTLCYKHEFLQSYVRSGGCTTFEMETATRSRFSPSVYSADIISAISSVGYLSSFEQCNTVTIKGTLYRKGHVLLLKQSSISNVLEIGTVFMILVDLKDSVKFVVQKGTAEMCPFTRAYKVNRGAGYVCVAPETLLSYYPLTPYIIDITKYLVLKHAVVNCEMV